MGKFRLDRLQSHIRGRASYMRKCEITIYEEAVCHIWLCNRSLNFLVCEENFFSFLSVYRSLQYRSTFEIFFCPVRIKKRWICPIRSLFRLTNQLPCINTFFSWVISTVSSNYYVFYLTIMHSSCYEWGPLQIIKLFRGLTNSRGSSVRCFLPFHSIQD
jgi:hypothetical protein